MASPEYLRAQAEAFKALADVITKAMRDFDATVTNFDVIERFNAIKGAEFIDTVAIESRKLAELLEREADRAEDAEYERSLISVGGKRDGGSAA